MQYSREILQKRYLGLPKDLKETLFSVETAEIIQKISKKYKLAAEQIPLLAKTTGDVILGVELLGNFIKSLSLILNVDLKTAEKIANDIKNKIFLPVKESLKKSQATPLNKAATPAKIQSKPPVASAPAIVPPTPPVVPANLPATSPAIPTPPAPVQQKEKVQQTKNSDIYKIRTMKQDIERAKQELTPQKSAEATENIVDLSKR